METAGHPTPAPDQASTYQIGSTVMINAVVATTVPESQPAGAETTTSVSEKSASPAALNDA